MDSFTKKPFYEHFINVDNIKKALPKDKEYFNVYYYLVLPFAFAAGFTPHIFGVTFEVPFQLGMLIGDFIFFLSLTYFAFRAIAMDRKYRVFKKAYMPFLLIGFYYLLAAIMFLTAYLTTDVREYEEGFYSVELSSQWLLIIYFVIYIGYSIFYHSACIKIFSRFTSRSIAKWGGEP